MCKLNLHKNADLENTNINSRMLHLTETFTFLLRKINFQHLIFQHLVSYVIGSHSTECSFLNKYNYKDNKHFINFLNTSERDFPTILVTTK